MDKYKKEMISKLMDEISTAPENETGSFRSQWLNKHIDDFKPEDFDDWMYEKSKEWDAETVDY